MKLVIAILAVIVVALTIGAVLFPAKGRHGKEGSKAAVARREVSLGA
ncbi:MAG: hypothetical protein PUC30_03820 [Lachnospiraceae bacterium]|nr:hypothetical protein [Lachnospiraceae bacterium]